MKFYFTRLLTPRPDFRATMSERERAIMAEHQVYMRGFAERGWAVAYGPVAAADGDFGATFWALPDDVDLARIVDNDPTILADAGFSREISPMPALIIGKAPSA